MKLDVYKTFDNGRISQIEIEKTFETNTYDLMYGTVEDILDVLDGLTGDDVTENDYMRVINQNRTKLNALILDVFPDMGEDDLRAIKVKDLIPMFVELFGFVRNSFGESKGKN